MTDAVVATPAAAAVADAGAVETIETAPEAAEAPVTKTEGSEATAAEPEKPAAAEARKRWKLKTDGVEEELEEDELLRRASLGGAAYKRMEAAAATQKAMNTLVEALTKDPVGTVMRIAKAKDLPIDTVKEAMAKVLLEDYEREKMDPKEREIAEREAEIARREAQQKALEEKQQAERQAQATAEHLKRLDVEFAEALKDSGLPKTPATVAELAARMERAIRNEWNVTAKDLVRDMQREHQANHKGLIGKLEGEDLVKFLGEDVVKRVRAYDAAQAKKNGAAPRPVAKPANAPPVKPGSKKPTTEAEWKARFGKF